MRKHLCTLTALLLFTLFSPFTTIAQDATPEAESGGFQLANSSTLLTQLGLREISLVIADDGSIDVPDQLTAGRYLVSLTGAPNRGGEIYFLQPPAGITDAEAKSAMMTLISDDVASAGWTYGGGAFTLPGQTFSIVLDLEPGDWTAAVSVEGLENEGGIVDVLFQRVAVTGTAPAFTEIDGAIPVDQTDFAFEGLDATISGPQIWKITNSGQEPHMIGLFRTPKLLDASDVLAVFTALSTGGTPPAGTPGIEEWQSVGYVQVISPGQTIWVEWTFTPADYLAICFVAGKDGMPHLAMGMAQGFSIE